jgi:hypothetical protein
LLSYFIAECEDQNGENRKLKSSVKQRAASSREKSWSAKKLDGSDLTLTKENTNNQLAKERKLQSIEQRASSTSLKIKSANEQLTQNSTLEDETSLSKLTIQNAVEEHINDSRHSLNEGKCRRASSLSSSKISRHSAVSSVESKEIAASEQLDADFCQDPHVTAYDDEQLQKLSAGQFEAEGDIGRKDRSESPHSRSSSRISKKHSKHSDHSSHHEVQQKQLVKSTSDEGHLESRDKGKSSKKKGTNRRPQSILKDSCKQSSKEQRNCERKHCNQEVESRCTATRECEFSDTDEASNNSCCER